MRQALTESGIQMPPEYFTFARLLGADKYSLLNRKNQPNLSY